MFRKSLLPIFFSVSILLFSLSCRKDSPVQVETTYQGDLAFYSQSEINSFSKNYKSVSGSLTIHSRDQDLITDLSPLANITSLNGNLDILSCDHLQNLKGLENIL